jgi:hypothetical protein
MLLPLTSLISCTRTYSVPKFIVPEEWQTPEYEAVDFSGMVLEEAKKAIRNQAKCENIRENLILVLESYGTSD